MNYKFAVCPVLPSTSSYWDGMRKPGLKGSDQASVFKSKL